MRINNLAKKTSLDINLLLRFVRKMNRQDVFDELLAEGIDTSDIDHYVELVMRSYQQIQDWVAENGDVVMRRKVGL